MADDLKAIKKEPAAELGQKRKAASPPAKMGIVTKEGLGSMFGKHQGRMQSKPVNDDIDVAGTGRGGDPDIGGGAGTAVAGGLPDTDEVRVSLFSCSG